LAVCHFHPDRPGIGLCMRCRRVICAACCTRLDGINHCHACLKKLGSRPDEVKGPNYVGPLLGVAVLGIGWLVLAGLGLLIQGLLAP
jgi:hypothetical protein